MCTTHARARAAQREALEVAVVAISAHAKSALPNQGTGLLLRVWLGLLLWCMAHPGSAAILPEERADTMYHSYSGGGVSISGPSVLVRKNFKEKYSMRANYYVDMVSSASIDVVTSASRYEEERTEKSLGVDILNDNSVVSSGISSSDENDYSARTATLDISHDFFGDLTNVSIGYTRGWDDVSKNHDTSFAERAIDRQSFRLSVSQVLTKNWLANVALEAISDEGFLNNPYRSYHYLDDNNERKLSPEIYPNTRTSNALSLRTRYYLPYRAAISGGYRYFNDTWDINAHSFEIGYTHPIQREWIIDVIYRYYTQTHADFYSDLFPYENAQNFMARDKELSTFQSHKIGLGVTREWDNLPWGWIEKCSANLHYDLFRFNYDDFRDATDEDFKDQPDQQKLYNFSANVIRLYISAWY
jgi:hypothetical protein